ncbi:Phage minor capsid protein 2 [Peptoniphilus asaccharolyticus DSM 20463]|uniref:Phage minor capsid protein 2 n=2 Tax=Peptoniphilus asaccharolyticus TaxID=1258 RepID=A0A1W1V015_PEPAS|nr:phage minor capsid protein [Peptoniphilus asaccharolyticus]SMB86351.1 Phage minor capsid protein 2 [Peptoniphilus asaccharolyticus DSM 20463]
MLTPKYMKKLPDNIQGYYRNLEDKTLKDIVKRINASCTIAETTSEVRIQSLLNLGYDLKDIKKELSKDLYITAHKLGSLVNKAGLKSYAEDAKYYAIGGKKLKENPAVLKMIDVMSKSSVEDLNNLTGTVGLAGKPLEKWYKETLNQAVIDITSGTYSRSEVMRQVVKDIGDKGLEYIEYSSGRNFSVEAAVKMNLVSSVNRLSAEISLKNAEEMNQDLMEITAHAGARPTHQEWQGQIVSLSGQDGYLTLNDIGYGSAEGFMGVNCRHNWYPYFPGKSKRFWDDETLEDFKYKGKTYDEHSAYQRIRNLEKTARKHERKAKLFNAIGDKEAETTEKVREQIVKQEQKKFQKVIKNNGTCYNKPRTLEDFEEYSKNYYEKNIKGQISKEGEDAIVNILNNLVDKSEFSMRFKSKNFDSLLESERFLNQFETGTSGGTISNKYRKEATKQLFGTGNKRLKASEREKYGYLGNNNFVKDYQFNNKYYSGVNQYGDVIVRFNKNIRDRVTFTIDNSLGEAVNKRIISSSVNDINVSCMSKIRLQEFNYYVKHDGEINTVEQLIEKFHVRYIETQYHGDLKLSDVSEICFTDTIPNNLEKLKDLGIKLFKIEGENIVEI